MENSDPLVFDFIRFCQSRCHGGWPELYDEMCRVAGQRLFRGLGYADLFRLGLALDLFGLDATHRLVAAADARPKPALAAV